MSHYEDQREADYEQSEKVMVMKDLFAGELRVTKTNRLYEGQATLTTGAVANVNCRNGQRKKAEALALAVNTYDERTERIKYLEDMVEGLQRQVGVSSLESDVKMLREALTTMTTMWCELVNSGDAGRWDPEKDSEVVASRKALAATEPKS